MFVYLFVCSSKSCPLSPSKLLNDFFQTLWGDAWRCCIDFNPFEAAVMRRLAPLGQPEAASARGAIGANKKCNCGRALMKIRRVAPFWRPKIAARRCRCCRCKKKLIKKISHGTAVIWHIAPLGRPKGAGAKKKRKKTNQKAAMGAWRLWGSRRSQLHNEILWVIGHPAKRVPDASIE